MHIYNREVSFRLYFILRLNIIINIDNVVMSLISFYFFHELFQVLCRFTDSRNCLTGYSKAGGSDNREKEVACYIKNQLEMSVVIIDNRKKESSKKKKKVLKLKAKL